MLFDMRNSECILISTYLKKPHIEINFKVVEGTLIHLMLDRYYYSKLLSSAFTVYK